MCEFSNRIPDLAASRLDQRKAASEAAFTCFRHSLMTAMPVVIHMSSTGNAESGNAGDGVGLGGFHDSGQVKQIRKANEVLHAGLKSSPFWTGFGQALCVTSSRKLASHPHLRSRRAADWGSTRFSGLKSEVPVSRKKARQGTPRSDTEAGLGQDDPTYNGFSAPPALAPACRI
jgi:hypothetical protein